MEAQVRLGDAADPDSIVMTVTLNATLDKEYAAILGQLEDLFVRRAVDRVSVVVRKGLEQTAKRAG